MRANVEKGMDVFVHRVIAGDLRASAVCSAGPGQMAT
jgi:hypothetical protein